MVKSNNSGKASKKPIGFANFDTLMRRLLGIKKDELKAELSEDARRRKAKGKKSKPL